eukprot:354254-Chlamydomonas_euryale.AAC.4
MCGAHPAHPTRLPAGANLPPSEERDWCLQCISTTFAVPWPDGIASPEEVDSQNWPRLNDFGACAARYVRAYGASTHAYKACMHMVPYLYHRCLHAQAKEWNAVWGMR